MDEFLRNMPPVVAIAGPTASGKSGLAVELARHLGGEVVNADAMQVYSGLRVLTARPTEAEMGGVTHHLFGHVDPRERYSVGQWSRDMMEVLGGLAARGVPAVLVGGTGLYFASLFKGLARIPEPDTETLASASAMPIGALQNEAERLDPVAFARVLGDDPQRLVRIVAVARASGKALSDWQAETHPLVTDWAGLVIMPDRDVLYARIEQRFDAMLEEGAMTEVEAIAARGLAPDLPAMKAIGVSHLLQALGGELSEAEAIRLAKRDSRRLAKRQMTWFRNQTPDWPRVELGAGVEAAMSALLQHNER